MPQGTRSTYPAHFTKPEFCNSGSTTASVVPGSRRRRSRRRWPRTPERSRSIPAWSCHRSVLSEPDAIDQTVNVYYIVLDRRSIAHGQVLLAQAIGHYPWQLGWRYRSPWRRVGRYESKREFSSSRLESAAATRTIGSTTQRGFADACTGERLARPARQAAAEPEVSFAEGALLLERVSPGEGHQIGQAGGRGPPAGGKRRIALGTLRPKLCLSNWSCNAHLILPQGRHIAQSVTLRDRNMGSGTGSTVCPGSPARAFTERTNPCAPRSLDRALLDWRKPRRA